MQLSSGAPRLRMAAVTKRYGAVTALRDAQLTLLPGEVMGLLGQNGAGKSTLVKILSGLVRPDAGTIEIDGRRVDLGSSAQAQDAGIAVVQQEHSSVGPLSVAENLLLGQQGMARVWTRARLARRARPLLDAVGLPDLDPHVPAESLSVAELQLVEIARVLAQDPRIVIFDEPTAALSDHEIQRVLDVVRRLAGEGRSIVYVTHRLAEVFAITDRVTVVRDGASLPPADTAGLDVAAVIAMMLGRRLDTLYPARGTSAADRLIVDGLLAEGMHAEASFSVRAGEITGLTGQLGSGAGAVVQALAGVIPAQARSLLLDGEPLALNSRRRGVARGVGFCSADRKADGIFASLSIEHNLSAAWLGSVTSHGWLRRRRESDAAAELGRALALDDRRMRAPVGTLSGGNQQKVALGRWLGADPVLMLVEEPTRGVDVGARAEIYGHLRRMCDMGLAVLVASSDSDEILGLCDRIGTFYRGRMTALRPSADWTAHELVGHVMHTEVLA